MSLPTEVSRIERTKPDVARTPFLAFKRSCRTEDFPEHFSSYVRSFGEVFPWPEGGFTVVTKAKVAHAVLTHPDFSANRRSFFLARMPDLDLSLIADFLRIISSMMVMSDGKSHQVRRRSVAQGFTEKYVQTLEKKCSSITYRLFDQAMQRRSFDIVTDIANALAAEMLADIFGISPDDRKHFFHCAGVMTGFFGGAVQYTNKAGIEVNQAALDLEQYFTVALAKREKAQSEDFLTFLRAQKDVLGLCDAELISQAIMMLVAGQVTTADQICNNAYQLLSMEPEKRRILYDQETLRFACEEWHRLDPAVTFLFRVCTRTTSILGYTFYPGETVFIANHAVNRDPELFDGPHEMRLDRKKNAHFAFGYGPHYCLGASLGRMQILHVLNSILQRLPEYRIRDRNDVSRNHYSLAFSGFKELCIHP